MKHTFNKVTFSASLLLFALIFSSFHLVEASVGANAFPQQATVHIPDKAILIAPGLYSLGSAIDAQSGEKVQGYMVVRPYKAYARPGSGNTSPTASCYGYLASGAKWKNVEPWVVNTTNAFNITHDSVFSILSNGISKWEDATNGVLNDGIRSADVIGTGASTDDILTADATTPDGVNEVYFGLLEDPNTIGVTIVWGVFGGPTKNRKLVEWDQVYNTRYNWSDAISGVSDAMDFESIATHELGHTMGLSDLYTSTCSTMTMYGYGAEGQTQARTLEDGDVNGMNGLY